MAWETRKGGRYFYRSRRVGGRVVKEYYGAGLIGQLAADLIAEARAHRAEEAAAYKAEQALLDELDVQVAALDAACDLIVAAALTAAGYHQTDRGAWRRRHD